MRPRRAADDAGIARGRHHAEWCWSPATGRTSPRAVGRIVGVDAVHADCDPADKLAMVVPSSGTLRRSWSVTASTTHRRLAAAGVGVALAARGATASAEAADVVLTVDRVDALADAILIARRSRAHRRRAVVVGMGASAVAMLAAAAGCLPPAAGALCRRPSTSRRSASR